MSSPKSQTKGADDFLGLSPGQIVDGRFVIEKLIGAGGQGLVFRVKHLEWNRDFALKLPLPKTVSSHKARERYLKEAETWIRMGVHPNIVRCWFVRPINGLPGLFLDLVSGGSLEDKIENGLIGPKNLKSILVVLLEVMEGLTHSHAMGVVHRDLKPENLMVHQNGKVGITDFGLVKTLSEEDIVESEGALPTKASVTEGAMGTPRYGAPEQWLAPATVSPATDIYSFGNIMYEMLCGQRPFDPPDRPAKALELINRHITEPAPDPRSVFADIPAPLAELCLQCMEKPQEKRPQSATEVLTRLSDILQTSFQRTYKRPAPVPAGERPDLLNNAAASLFPLGKTKKARELLLKGLMMEAGHPQCLYNLVQLDRREGKIESAESFRRLSRAKLDFELALLYIEEGCGPEATDILERLPEERKTGFVCRTEGDALMYSGRFAAAHKAYQRAQALMPSDRPTQFRKELAKAQQSRHQGNVYFPSLTSCYTSKAPNPQVAILLSPESERIIGIDERNVVTLSIETNSVLGKAARPADGSAVLASWTSGNRLLLQDHRGLELWDLDSVSMLHRSTGRVLAATQDLSKAVLLTEQGVGIVEFAKAAMRTVTFPPGTQPSRHVLASFTPTESGVGLLTPDGRLATLNFQFEVVPLEWPPPFPNRTEIFQFRLGSELATLATNKGIVHCIHLGEKQVIFQRNLGFAPERIELDAADTVQVFSSSQRFCVLSKGGKILMQGEGPCALDASRQNALIWSEGVLNLYQLSPFHRIRRWNETIPVPQSLGFAADGRRGLSFDRAGEYRVWEIDEPSRVYERHLLVTPGESYEELITSYESYSRDLAQAELYCRQNKHHASYVTLQKARTVSGFQQAEDALELQWTLCGKLQRDGLEAVWERLYISDVVSGQLSADCRHLLIAQAFSAELSVLSGPKITQKLLLQSERELLGANCVTDRSGRLAVITLTRCGLFQCVCPESGEVLLSQELEVGTLRSVRFRNNLALIHSEQNNLVTLDLETGGVMSQLDLGKRQLESVFGLHEGKAMLVTAREHLLADVKAATLKPGLPLDMNKLPGHISFVSDLPSAKIRMTGFTDGTLIMSHQKSGEPIFAINQENGSVTGAVVNLNSGLGVSVSAQGGITFFDLCTARVLDRFIAHAEGVAEIAMTEDGRYITTKSITGQFRLWEISWLLSDRKGGRQIDWLPSSGLSKIGRFFGRK